MNLRIILDGTEAQEAVVSTVSNVGVERKKLIQCWWYDFNNFRRLAHIVEYFPFGIAAVIPFRIVYKKKSVCLSFLVCALVSLIDQSLKGILPTREFDVKDMVLDLRRDLSRVFFPYCKDK